MKNKFDLIEHKSEGKDMLDVISHLIKNNIKLKNKFDNDKRLTLLYCFNGNSCRRCLNQELRLFNKKISQENKKIINIIMMLTNFEKIDFYTICKQYGIEDMAFNVKIDNISQKLGASGSQLSMLLSNNMKVIYLNRIDYQNENKSIAFYNKRENIIDSSIQ